MKIVFVEHPLTIINVDVTKCFFQFISYLIPFIIISSKAGGNGGAFPLFFCAPHYAGRQAGEVALPAAASVNQE